METGVVRPCGSIAPAFFIEGWFRTVEDRQEAEGGILIDVDFEDKR